jgi:hypothetical protein
VSSVLPTSTIWLAPSVALLWCPIAIRTPSGLRLSCLLLLSHLKRAECVCCHESACLCAARVCAGGARGYACESQTHHDVLSLRKSQTDTQQFTLMAKAPGTR